MKLKDSQPNLKKVLIGTVSENNSVSLEYSVSLAESVRATTGSDITIFPLLCNSAGNTTMRFNQLLTAAWKEEADALVLVSPDGFWSLESLLSLVNSETEVVALPVCGLSGFLVEITDIERLQTNSAGEIKVKRTDLGFFKLGAEALKSLCESSPSIQYEGGEVKLVISGTDLYSSYATDSEVLTSRLRECGYEVWLNPNYTVQTTTVQKTRGDFAMALKEAKGE